MKRRAGFVSNSSSTSFCIFGVIIDDAWDDDIENVIWRDESGSSLIVERGVDEYYNTNFVGVDPNEIKNSETFGEFKIRVAKNISKVVGVDVSIDSLKYYTDGGRDG